MSDDEKNLAKAAMSAQSLQLKMWAGMILGGLVGIVLAAYVILPYLGGSQSLGALAAAIATVFVCVWAGQRIVLGMVAR